MPRPSIALADFVDQYAETRDLAWGTVEQLRYAVASLNRWNKRSIRVDQLNDQRVNRWLEWMLAIYARPTVRNRRGAVLTLWLAAHDEGLVRSRPGRIKPIKVPRDIPRAWTIKQAAEILTACKDLPGRFRGRYPIERKALMRAWVLVDWYTGLRPCDMLALRTREIADDGTFLVRQIKTGVPLLRKLPIDALRAVRATYPPDREFVFPISMDTLQYWLSRLLVAAAIDEGSAKWIRRSSATAVEAQSPGAATGFLGHKTPGLAYKHYVDLRQIQIIQPMPPPIAG